MENKPSASWTKRPDGDLPKNEPDTTEVSTVAEAEKIKIKKPTE